MITNYLGSLRQSLLDLSDWVERGIEPRESTVYTLEDNQVIVPEKATGRKGLQPTVQLTANGSTGTYVKVGEPVTFQACIQTPEGTGTITPADFDFVEQIGLPIENGFAHAGTIEKKEDGTYVSEITHVYEKSGTYYASVRVKEQRDGDEMTFSLRSKILQEPELL